LLHIELQEHMRAVLKDRVGEQKNRKRILYTILGDERVNVLLKEGKLDEAKKEAIEIMKKTIVKDKEAQN
jgi:siroheme synthase (precorrin-2 oxidase/ferrochelatase)